MQRAAVLVVVGAIGCSSGGAGRGASDGGPPPNGCTYPAGPYGDQVGDVVDGTLSWQGYVDDATQPSTVTMADVFDCDGTKGIRAVLVDESAVWCGDCVNQAMTIEPLLSAQWKTEGVRLVVLMAQNADSAHPGPATIGDALTWRNEFALVTGTAVCADPQWTEKTWGTAPSGGNGFPTDTIVDPRTMKIVAVQPASVFGTIDNLAKANGG
jgi:hypothetical protein